MTVSQWLVALAVGSSLSGGIARAEASGGGKAWMTRLIADSKAKWLGDSDAYYEGRRLGSADLPRFLRYIRKHPDYTSYHLLLVVRRDQRAAYRRIPAEVRASVLCSAIKENDYLGGDWEEPCVEVGFQYPPKSNHPDEALIEIGKPALRHLLPLLDDYRAVSFGDEEEGPEYDDYRRADVALRLASAILEVPYEFRPKPADRDKAIQAFKRKVLTRPQR
jgi:hypothetical protein